MEFKNAKIKLKHQRISNGHLNDSCGVSYRIRQKALMELPLLKWFNYRKKSYETVLKASKISLQ